MPYRLINAPAVFQSLVNKVFRDMLHRYVITYIDDILIYSTNLEQHITPVHVILRHLAEDNLFTKLEKCE